MKPLVKDQAVKIIKPGSHRDGMIGRFWCTNVDGTITVLDAENQPVIVDMVDVVSMEHCLVKGQKYRLKNKENGIDYGVFKFDRMEGSTFWGFDSGGKPQFGDALQLTFTPENLPVHGEFCEHDWKFTKGFRLDNFCCTKCPATRRYDPAKDDVA